MKAYITRGNSFRGAVEYILEEKQGLVIRSIDLEKYEAELAMVETARLLSTQNTHTLSDEQVEKAIQEFGEKNGFTPTVEQQAAIRHCCQSSFDIVQGSAGAGKTASVKVIKAAYEQSGYQFIGACTSKRAAQNLEADSDIASHTIASLLKRIETGSLALTDKTVLVIDEAGMVSQPDFEKLISITDQAGAKLIATGEDKQIDAIERGGVLRYLSRENVIGCARIEGIRRQSLDQNDPDPEWRRKTVMAFRDGRGVEAVKNLDERGLINICDNQTAAVDQLVDDYLKYNADHPESQSIILARRWKDIQSINNKIREHYKAEGRLDSYDHSIECSVSGKEMDFKFSKGEFIKFCKNDRDLGVINGTLGTITEISQRGNGSLDLTVKTTDGATIKFNTKDYSNDNGRAYLATAYALTNFASQGITVDGDAFVLHDNGADRANSYVPGSRAKDNTHFYTDQRAIDRHIRTDAHDLDTVITHEHRLEALGRLMSRDKYSTLQLEVAEQKRLNNAQEVKEWITDQEARRALRKEIIHTNMSGDNARELSAEFAVARELRPDAKNPVWHCSLSATKTDGKLSDEKWRALIDDFMAGIGIDTNKHQFVVSRHSDTEHDHIHIITSRIALDGEIWHGKFEHLEAIKITQQLEKKHGLELTPGLEGTKLARVSRKEHEMFDRALKERGETRETTNLVVPKEYIKSAVELAVEQSGGDASKFFTTLENAGVKPILAASKNGNVYGISYQLADRSLLPDGFQDTYKGSQIARDCSIDQIEMRLEKQLKLESTLENNNDRRQETIREYGKQWFKNAGFAKSRGRGIAQENDGASADQRPSDRAAERGYRADASNGRDTIRRDTDTENERERQRGIHQEHNRAYGAIQEDHRGNGEKNERGSETIISTSERDQRSGERYSLLNGAGSRERTAAYKDDREAGRDQRVANQANSRSSGGSDRTITRDRCMGMDADGARSTKDGCSPTDSRNTSRARLADKAIESIERMEQTQSLNVPAENRIAEQRFINKYNELVRLANNANRNRLNERIEYIQNFRESGSIIAKASFTYYHADSRDKEEAYPRELYAAYAHKAFADDKFGAKLSDMKTAEAWEKLDKQVVTYMKEDRFSNDQVSEVLEQGSPGWMLQQIKHERGIEKQSALEYEQKLKKQADRDIELQAKLRKEQRLEKGCTLSR